MERLSGGLTFIRWIILTIIPLVILFRCGSISLTHLFLNSQSLRWGCGWHNCSLLPLFYNCPMFSYRLCTFCFFLLLLYYRSLFRWLSVVVLSLLCCLWIYGHNTSCRLWIYGLNIGSCSLAMTHTGWSIFLSQ